MKITKIIKLLIIKIITAQFFFTINSAENEVFLDNIRIFLAKSLNQSNQQETKNGKINELNIIFDDILKKYSNIKKNEVIEFKDLNELNVFYGNESEPNNNFITKINRCKTSIGKYLLASKIANPTTDVDELTDIQNIIKILLENDELRTKIGKLLVEFSKIEHDIIDFFNKKSNIYDKNNNQKLIKKFYFKGRTNSNKTVKTLYLKKIFTDIFDVIIKPYYSGIGIALYLASYFIIFDNITDKLFLKLSQFVPIPGFKEIVSLINIGSIIKMLNKRKSLIAGGLFIGGIITSIYSFINLYKKFKSYKYDFKVIFDRVKNIQTVIKILNELIKIIDNDNKYNIISKKIKNIKNMFKSDIYELNWAINFLLNKNLNCTYLSYNSPAILAIFNILNYNRDTFINPLCELIEIDTYLSMCNLLNNNNLEFSFTKFIKSDKPIIILKDIWSPLIDSKNVIKNDLDIGNSFSNMLLCGHNGGGKSTYLNSILLNLILIQTYGISMSKYSGITIFDKINIFLNTSDDINKGDSLYKAEIKKLKKYIELCKNTKNTNKFIFSVFEEPLKGTDSKSAVAILMGTFKYLSKNNKNIINIVSSHYNKLTELENLPNFKNFCPAVRLDKNQNLIYLYKIKQGFNHNSLAIPIAKKIGINNDIISLIENEYNKYVE